MICPFEARRPATHTPRTRIATNGLGVVAEGPLDRLVDAPAELAASAGSRTATGNRGRAFTCDVHSPLALGARWQAEVEQRLR